MSFTVFQASAPVFLNGLADMRAWLDKASEAHMEARLAPDMRPLAAQYQMASDTAKNAMARLTGETGPAMPDTETTLDELRARCDATSAYVGGFDEAALADAAARPVALTFPNGMGYAFTGADFLTRFALPNFFFHVTTAYAILRHAGVPLGKPDFLQHLGPPSQMS